MKIAYFDCFAGASGDMIVGALLDLGLPLGTLEEELGKIAIGDFEIGAKKTTRQHIGATKFNVVADEHKIVRTWKNVRELIEESALSERVKADSLAIFERIAKAEAKVHRRALEQVHFHEVGAIDSIVDVVSSVVGLQALGIEKLYSSPVATGMGMIKTEHGMLPVPAPATLEILSGAPIYSSGVAAELTTPTGAAILMQYASFVEDIPKFVVKATGYGAGERDLEVPNVLRVIIGEAGEAAADEVYLIETNIDDAPAEVLGYTMGALLELGALDVWFTPIAMKKSRPAVTLSVLCPIGFEDAIAEKIFAETATLGLRITKQPRLLAEREVISVSTPLGRVRAKVGKYKGKTISVAPEYDDVSKLAIKSGLPFKQVYELAREAAQNLIERG